MRRGTIAAAVLATALAVPSSAGAEDIDHSHGAYKRHAKVRDQVEACILDRTYRHLSAEKRRTCRRYRSRYVLYSYYGSSDFYLHCLTRRCPPRLPGESADPRAPIPRGTKVYRP